jgi:hypothetical protein
MNCEPWKEDPAVFGSRVRTLRAWKRRYGKGATEKALVRTREVRGLKLSRSSETNLRLTGFPERLVNRVLNAALNLRLVGVGSVLSIWSEG